MLAFIALAGGARRVVALDNEPVAALTARENGLRNRLSASVAAGGVDCLRRRPLFDLAVVNILPRHVFDELGEIAARLRPGAEAVFSGLLEADRPCYEARLDELGLVVCRRRRSDDWVALAARASR